MREIRPGKTTFFVANQDNIDALSEHKVKALAEETEALAERNKTLATEIKAASAGVCACSCALPPSLALRLCWKRRGAPRRRLHIYMLTGNGRPRLLLMSQNSHESRTLLPTRSSQRRLTKSSPRCASAALATTCLTATTPTAIQSTPTVIKQVAKLREHLEPLRAGTPLVSTTELDVLDAEWVKWRAEWVRRRKVFYKYAHPPFLPYDGSEPASNAPLTISIFLNGQKKASGRSCLTRCPRLTRPNLPRISGLSTIRRNISNWNAGLCVRLQMLPDVADLCLSVVPGTECFCSLAMYGFATGSMTISFSSHSCTQQHKVVLKKCEGCIPSPIVTKTRISKYGNTARDTKCVILQCAAYRKQNKRRWGKVMHVWVSARDHPTLNEVGEMYRKSRVRAINY